MAARSAKEIIVLASPSRGGGMQCSSRHSHTSIARWALSSLQYRIATFALQRIFRFTPLGLAFCFFRFSNTHPLGTSVPLGMGSHKCLHAHHYIHGYIRIVHLHLRPATTESYTGPGCLPSKEMYTSEHYVSVSAQKKGGKPPKDLVADGVREKAPLPQKKGRCPNIVWTAPLFLPWLATYGEWSCV